MQHHEARPGPAEGLGLVFGIGEHLQDQVERLWSTSAAQSCVVLTQLDRSDVAMARSCHRAWVLPAVG